MKAHILIAITTLLMLFGCTGQPVAPASTAPAPSLTGSVLEAQAQYCSQTDPLARLLILTAIRRDNPDYPADGLCTDLTELIEQQ